MHSDDKPLREIDDTAGSAAEDRFEEIIQRVEATGAEITKDEETPLYTTIGLEQYEIGEQRVVAFTLNNIDFEITRLAKMARITGEGHHKTLEELPRPSIDIKLKRKPETSDQWVIVDLEDMF